MMQIVFVACLLGQPGNCLESQLVLWDAPSPRACMRIAQGALAQWKLVHPKYGIVQWACLKTDDLEYPA